MNYELEELTGSDYFEEPYKACHQLFLELPGIERYRHCSSICSSLLKSKHISTHCHKLLFKTPGLITVLRTFQSRCEHFNQDYYYYYIHFIQHLSDPHPTQRAGWKWFLSGYMWKGVEKEVYLDLRNEEKYTHYVTPELAFHY